MAASIPSVSVSAGVFGQAMTVYTNRENTSYTHHLTALLYTGRTVESAIASDVAASVQWTPPMDLMEHIPNAASARARIRCTTYDAKGSLVGLAFSDYFTIDVPSSAKPIISGVAVERINNQIPSAWGIFVKGYSQARIKVTASGQYGATIQSCEIFRASASAPAIPTMYGTEATTGILSEAGIYPLTARVVDSRGLISTMSARFEVVDYSSPQISDAKFERCLADGTPNDDGTYLKVSAKLSIASCKRCNSYTASVQYRIKGASTWSSAGAYTSGSTKIYNIGMGDSAYEIRIALQDALRTSYATSSLDIGTILYEYDPDANKLEFKVPITFPGWPPEFPATSESGTYKGYGRTGSSAKNSIEFLRGRPKMVLIQKKGAGEWGALLLASGAETGWSVVGTTASGLVVSISDDNIVSWYYNSADSHPANQLDTRNAAYTYVGIF